MADQQDVSHLNIANRLQFPTPATMLRPGDPNTNKELIVHSALAWDDLQHTCCESNCTKEFANAYANGAM